MLKINVIETSDMKYENDDSELPNKNLKDFHITRNLPLISVITKNK